MRFRNELHPKRIVFVDVTISHGEPMEEQFDLTRTHGLDEIRNTFVFRFPEKSEGFVQRFVARFEVHVRAIGLHDAFKSEGQISQKRPYVAFFLANILAYDNISPTAPSTSFRQPYPHKRCQIITDHLPSGEFNPLHVRSCPYHRLWHV